MPETFNYPKFDYLPELLKNQVETMPIGAQSLFAERYMKRAKSPWLAYMAMILGSHYAYLHRWDDQLFFYLTLGGIGFWWVGDIFRLRDMVYQYNTALARNILKDLRDESNSIEQEQ